MKKGVCLASSPLGEKEARVRYMRWVAIPQAAVRKKTLSISYVSKSATSINIATTI